MGWKCPDCGVEHKDISSECSCGFSVYKVLGIKPGASGEEARQAYTYLLKVWESDRSSHDPVSKKKAEERLRKINEAYGIFKKNLPVSPAALKKNNAFKIAASAGVVLILLVALALYSNVLKSDGHPGLQSAQKKMETALPAGPAVSSMPVGQVNAGQASGPAVQEIPQAPAQPALSGEITEEKAIEIVKKSHALYRNTSTEALIKKWSDENAAKFQIIGWNARKMDEEIYLVSYTAMDGAFPKGFYFALDIRTGEVENLENKPELQKKYNIQYSK